MENIDVEESVELDDFELSVKETTSVIKEWGVTRAYIHEASRERLLAHEEEIELSKRAMQGDINARNELIRGNLRLVMNIARRYTHRGLDLADLINEGSLGLFRAIDKFDPDKGFRFSTYGTWWVRHFIEKAIVEQGRMIRLPANIERKIARFKRLILH